MVTTHAAANHFATALEALQYTVRTCRRCVVAGHIPEATPILHGNSAARVMVLGQAPGATAAERPLPYSGATGRTLRGWLERAGFPPEHFHDPDRFYLTSLTKCFPGKAHSGAGDRAPSRQEIALCSGHLYAELALVQPELIVALGRIAILTLLPSQRTRSLSEIIGTAYPAELLAAGSALVLPLPHPSGVSRWHNVPENRDRVVAALAWLATAREEHGW
jgi:uracil-DNA glycosylase family 4